jgi:hypothetical protein
MNFGGNHGLNLLSNVSIPKQAFPMIWLSRQLGDPANFTPCDDKNRKLLVAVERP